MAISARWLDVGGAAKVLGITPADVHKMINNGQCVTQMNGSTIEVGFFFNPKATPKYALMPLPPKPINPTIPASQPADTKGDVSGIPTRRSSNAD